MRCDWMGCDWMGRSSERLKQHFLFRKHTTSILLDSIVHRITPEVLVHPFAIANESNTCGFEQSRTPIVCLQWRTRKIHYTKLLLRRSLSTGHQNSYSRTEKESNSLPKLSRTISRLHPHSRSWNRISVDRQSVSSRVTQMTGR